MDQSNPNQIYDTVITVEDFESAINQTWGVWDVFDEERDRYPLREIVLTVVEGLFTHPSGQHNIMDLNDSVSGLVTEIIDSSLPDVVANTELDSNARNYGDTVGEKYRKKMEQKVSKHAERLYEEVKDEAEEKTTISGLQTLLEETAESMDIPEYA